MARGLLAAVFIHGNGDIAITPVCKGAERYGALSRHHKVIAGLA